MKTLLLTGAVSLFLLASCRQNAENGGEEIRGNEQRSDTPMNMNHLETNRNLPDSGGPGTNASGTGNNAGTNNNADNNTGANKRDTLTMPAK